ncbi:hypothetical protein BS47DRAFT_1401209 [Hydnum rufescens UP504]|uniref:DUF4100 domain-containing protein n=1 Tax=Hydnum rufescens UP504 TaxID=1448309 RepID=A0A9P6AG72_9AGAM|nr:hypothetical protein BS47DRAFT_1401209 [Hydnum rufescens UP504]
MEHSRNFNLLNQEFTTFGEHDYEVFPASHEQICGQKRPRSDDKEEPRPKKMEHPKRAYIELPQHPVSKQEPESIVNKPPTILKREIRPPEPSTAILPNEDIEMRDGTADRPRVHRPALTETQPMTPRDKAKATLDDVIIRDGNGQTKKRASPAYRFVSELQENTDVEALFKSLMSQEVSVRLGNILGSSFELGKRLQIATKTQRVPVSPEAMQMRSGELSISSAEHGFNPLEMKTRPPRRPLIYRPPKGDHGVNAPLVDSDDETTDEDSPVDNTFPKFNSDGEANEFYTRDFEDGHKPQFDIRETDYSLHPSFLAMVTARIQGTIFGHPCTMLIDNGSELNIMVQSVQLKLQLPIDLSAEDWLL